LVASFRMVCEFTQYDTRKDGPTQVVLPVLRSRFLTSGVFSPRSSTSIYSVFFPLPPRHLGEDSFSLAVPIRTVFQCRITGITRLLPDLLYNAILHPKEFFPPISRAQNSPACLVLRLRSGLSDRVLEVHSMVRTSFLYVPWACRVELAFFFPCRSVVPAKVEA